MSITKTNCSLKIWWSATLIPNLYSKNLFSSKELSVLIKDIPSAWLIWKTIGKLKVPDLKTNQSISVSFKTSTTSNKWNSVRPILGILLQALYLSHQVWRASSSGRKSQDFKQSRLNWKKKRNPAFSTTKIGFFRFNLLKKQINLQTRDLRRNLKQKHLQNNLQASRKGFLMNSNKQRSSRSSLKGLWCKQRWRP